MGSKKDRNHVRTGLSTLAREFWLDQAAERVRQRAGLNPIRFK